MTRTDWKSGQHRARIRNLLAYGWPLDRIAESLGVSESSLRQACDMHGFAEPPRRWIYLSELTVALGVDRQTAKHHALQHGRVRLWGGRRIVPARLLRELAWLRREVQTEPPAGWLCAADLMAHWGQSHNTVRRKVRHLPSVQVRRGRSTVHYYAPADVLALTPMRLRRTPPGLLTGPALADALGIKPKLLTSWRHRYGLPASPWRARDNKSLLYDPVQVAAWLREHPLLAHYAPRLEGEVAA